MSERREIRLVRNEDGSWRSWDNSIDDCMDSRESMLVREVLPSDGKGPVAIFNSNVIRKLRERQAELRSAAGAALEHFDLEPPRGDKESHRVLVRLAAALESEAGNE